MGNIQPIPGFFSRTIPLLLLTIIFASLGGIPMASAQKKSVPAPELTGGAAWLNVPKPLTLADLKGKVVLLDFWTYCCINCMHIIPDLKKLEAKYPKELVVIGVHSAKHRNERESENIRQAILRYEIEHPVINDSDFALWQAYGVRAWPTLVLIDPEGNIVGSDSGEGHYEILDTLIGKLASDFRSKNLINEKPVPLSPEKYKRGHGYLSFPGKILADEPSKRLFIADSNHNRIVITNSEGEVLDIAGNGETGRNDGGFKDARFHHPQGMALHGDDLYVADTENHLIRKLDLKAKTVKTIAGTGRQAAFMDAGGMGISSPLNSPWDLAYLGGHLYIAMAGAHQLWVMDMATTVFQPFAGSGREGIADGSQDGCSLAQPSGITTDGKKLYYADSETSAVRYVDMENKTVKTIIGKGLFDFGDKDGSREEARLQHPLGVAYHDGLVFVADTYNHKIKIVNPGDNTCVTFAGDGHAGFIDGAAPRFYEPGGLSIAGDKLYVADTNNHAIRVIELKTRETGTLQIHGIKTEASKDTSPSAIPPFARLIELSAKTLKPDAETQLTLNIQLPKGYHLNPHAPLIYRTDAGSGLQVEQSKQEVQLENPVLPLKISIKTGAETERTEVKVSATFYFCREDNQGACYIDAVVWRQPIRIDKESANTTATLDYEVKLP